MYNQSVAEDVNVKDMRRIVEEELPEDYIWKEKDRPQLCYNDYEGQQLPIIDLSGGAFDVSNQILDACREWGAFQVINHGVSEQVVARARKSAMELFELPEAIKLRALRRPGNFFGYGATRMAPFFDRLMWSEAFTMMGSPNPNIIDYASRLWTSNAEFCQCFEEYDAGMRRLAARVVRPILQSLGVAAEQVEDIVCSFWGWLHMNYYPPCPNPLKAMGLAAHTDSSCLTIMHQGDVGGLQVKKDETWIAVKPHWNAFVIQVGDMLQVMSNGCFKSVVHRAVVNNTFTRLSLVYFLSPPPFSSISPLGLSCKKRLYRCFTWNDYLKAKAEYFMEALEQFKLTEED